MKVALVGHTGQIGMEISGILGNDKIKGYSRSTGWDVSNVAQHQSMIDDMDDCDVFIDASSARWENTKLLIKLYQNWKDINGKQIIVIGSDAADYDDQTIEGIQYAAVKAAHKKASRIIQYNNSECELKYVSFGYIDTDDIRAKYPNLVGTFIPVEEAGKIICSLISNT